MHHLTPIPRPAFRLSAADAAAGLALSMPHRLPTTHRAALGLQRAFLTRHDALAYDAGWRMHPATCYAELGTPASMGWHDRQQQRMAPVEYEYEGTLNDEMDADERASDLAYRRAGVRSPASYIPRMPVAPVAPKNETSEAAS